ncbi:MAG: serine/threonine-protein kinase [Gemmataceae bacterium]
MSRCPACSAPLTDPAGCPACGGATVALPPPSEAFTHTAAPADPLLTLTRGACPPPDPTGFRLAPGTLLADRYRIVAPLGRGGMGEVYRADDLALGVAVALKFLPEQLAANPARLTAFRKEVAAARQVSHPNVCRVFDIGEAGGQSFLSMEFIPGDDLAGALGRVGRLTPDVACDLGRQIALGLQAVHEEGLVHRDLKPANVMVDGRGRAKLTDFGLAATAASVSGADAYAGTPAYQAPEQLAGGAITERTDVYALGVVVYELLTGRRPFVGPTRKELIDLQKSPPAKPSELAPGVGPEVDRVVLKCLAFDPKDRPASAHEVWRALPGDAALNAALASGQTPTAEAVADAGGEGRLSRRVALLLTAWTGLMVSAVMVMSDWTSELRLTPSRPPAELRAAAQGMLRRYGPAGHVADMAGGFDANLDLFTWRNTHDPGADRLAPLADGRLTEVRYWYRENPVPLVAEPVSRTVAVVTSTAPPVGLPGSATVQVDPVGRLLALERAVPAGRVPAGGNPDWEPLFAAAGLDPAAFRPCDPAWGWRVPHNRRAAWVGGYPDRPGVELRVEAAADRGEPVGFRLVAPWTRPDDDLATQLRRFDDKGYAAREVVLPLMLLVVGTGLAAWHVRAGRADLLGAGRFAAAFGTVHLAVILLLLHPVGDGHRDFDLAFGAVARVGLNAVLVAAAYLALEPFVRRRWPRLLVGWTRLLAGRLTDPGVGRELLVGAAGGATAAGLMRLAKAAPGWLGFDPDLPVGWATADRPLSSLLAMVLTGTEGALALLFLAFLVATAVRARRLYEPILVGLGAWMYVLYPTLSPAVVVPIAVLTMVVGVGVLLRGGLLAGSVVFTTALLLFFEPITYDLTVWYWKSTAVVLGAVAAVTLYGLVVSVGGWRKLVRPASDP